MDSKILVAWDFNGVLNTFGTGVVETLAEVARRGGENIVVSNSTQAAILEFLTAQHLQTYISAIYGMDKHHGLVVRHKVAALKGHIHDAGPFDFVLMIGDSLDDMADAHEAGVEGALYDPHHFYDQVEHFGNHVIRDFGEVKELLPV